MHSRGTNVKKNMCTPGCHVIAFEVNMRNIYRFAPLSFLAISTAMTLLIANTVCACFCVKETVNSMGSADKPRGQTLIYLAS